MKEWVSCAEDHDTLAGFLLLLRTTPLGSAFTNDFPNSLSDQERSLSTVISSCYIVKKNLTNETIEIIPDALPFEKTSKREL
jgi:hypothetical protein